MDSIFNPCTLMQDRKLVVLKLVCWMWNRDGSTPHLVLHNISQWGVLRQLYPTHNIFIRSRARTRSRAKSKARARATTRSKAWARVGAKARAKTETRVYDSLKHPGKSRGGNTEHLSVVLFDFFYTSAYWIILVEGKSKLVNSADFLTLFVRPWGKAYYREILY